jgi:threonine synthase
VKKLFGDKALAQQLDTAGFSFSSANSINIGRLVPQIVYDVYAYGRLLKSGELKAGEPMNVVVPTGNFGNILAAYYAKNMGLPIGKLICASNENKVLFDFFQSGTYDRNREFMLTSSPSMDILISSNLERLIYRIAGDDAAVNAALMKELSEKGSYTITDAMREKMADFTGGYATGVQTAEEIARVYGETGYVLDTHTAVASRVYREYAARTADQTKTVIASTASPYKFAGSVMEAIDPKYQGMDDFVLIDELCRISGTKIPRAIEEIRNAPVLHDKVIEKDEMEAAVKQFLGIA